MNLTVKKEKYLVGCDMNCGKKSQVLVCDDAGNSYMHICLDCIDKLTKCFKNYKNPVKKAEK